MSPPPTGRLLIATSWWATAAFVTTATLATVALSTFQSLALAVALTLFGAGMITMLWAFFIAVGRSRVDAIGVGGLYFGAGSAPRMVRIHLLGALGVQIITGVASASARVFTTLAFGTLVPVFGLGMLGLWSARHGIFEPTDRLGGPTTDR